jgi:hypothetical protein
MSAALTPPTFRGPLAPQFESFLAYRQDLRTCHEHVWVAVRHLDGFLLQHAPTATSMTEPLRGRGW